MKFNLSKTALLAAMISIGSNAYAGMQDEMDNLFGSMSNVTAPGVYETQTRGVISAGRVSIKHRIVEAKPISWVPPSIKSGCGGIDLHGGSFSYINSEQLTQLLRAVAANAKGYAFQIALQTYAPEVSSMIEVMQKKIQQINELMSNSCQMAQGLVDGGVTALKAKEGFMASIEAQSSGVAKDMFSGYASNSKKDLSDADPDTFNEKFVGNLVWKQLKQNNAASWYKYGDDEMLEVVMSITGTIIKLPLEDDEKGNPETPNRTVSGLAISLQDVIEGGDVTYYKCDDTTDCLEPEGAVTTLTGIEELITDALIGTESSTGLIKKLRTNVGEPTDLQKSVLISMPQYSGTFISKLAIVSESSAEVFAREAAKSAALEMTTKLIGSAFITVRSALQTTDDPMALELLESIRENELRFAQQVNEYYANITPSTELIAKYNEIIKNVPKKKTVAPEAVAPSKRDN